MWSFRSRKTPKVIEKSCGKPWSWCGKSQIRPLQTAYHRPLATDRPPPAAHHSPPTALPPTAITPPPPPPPPPPWPAGPWLPYRLPLAAADPRPDPTGAVWCTDRRHGSSASVGRRGFVCVAATVQPGRADSHGACHADLCRSCWSLPVLLISLVVLMRLTRRSGSY